MEAHCPSRAGGQGWRLSATRRPRPGRLRAQRNTWASALAFHNCRFPLAGSWSCQNYPILEDRRTLQSCGFLLRYTASRRALFIIARSPKCLVRCDA